MQVRWIQVILSKLSYVEVINTSNINLRKSKFLRPTLNPTQKRYYNYIHKFKLWQSIIQTLFSAGNNQVLVRLLSFTTILNKAIGRLCEKCDGKCVICDSYVRPCTLVRICDECNYGSYQGRCVICGGPGVSDAYYCRQCTCLEKDRDGCPKIVNLGSAKTDLFYERKKYGFKKR
ncbi:unnamed protein product [Schistosoma mattheei]|uniref:PHD finger-like domain-containing protein 5A n=1 Tax=Schistosoma mattheei TaxID=31246 RepID=A0AA85AQG0_9TREM|nr:unnamed protein product [Schistosoma mattheei]